MTEFLSKLSEFLTFENQVYLMMGVLLLLIILCFILLIVVGSKYKKLLSIVNAYGKDPEEEPIDDAVSESFKEIKRQQEEEIKQAEASEAADLQVPVAEDENAAAIAEENPERKAENAEEIADDSAENDSNADREATFDFEPSEIVEATNLISQAEIININEKMDRFEKLLDETVKAQRKCFDKIKVVRYSSTLEDGTVAPSYSVGITNSAEDGLILTGVSHQEGTVLEVKSICSGSSNQTLSMAEECTLKRKKKSED